MQHHVQSTAKKGGRFFFRATALAIASSLVLFAAPATASSAKLLSGDELKSFIAGKRVYLATPLGGELPLYYRTNGTVDGSGQAVGLGKYMTPKDSGRWWVKGNRLCQKWKEWYKGRTFCFTVAKLSGNRIEWRRDDGAKGIARVGR